MLTTSTQQLKLESLHCFSFTLTIPFRDVDSWGMVWHGHYLSYVDAARAALLKKAGLCGSELIRLGFFMPIVRVELDYKRSAKVEDELRVEIAMVAERATLVSSCFRMVHAQSNLVLVQGKTEQVLIRTDGTLLYHFPPELQPIFRKLSHWARGTEKMDKE